MHYDSDDARNRSPPLEPAHPDYQPRETPVPFVTDESQSPEAKPGGAGTDCKRPNRRRIDPNSVLSAKQILMSIGADQEIIDGVECQSPGPNESEPVSPTEPLKREPRRQSESPKVSTQAAQNALDLINAEPDRPKPPSPSAIKLEKSTQEEAQPHFPVLPGVSHLESLADSSRRPGEGLGSIGGGLGRLSGILGPIHPLQCPPLPPIATDYREDRRPIATSPRLRPFAIPPSERTAGETLPALHSPPHSAAANSPETSLPSLKATFPDGLGDTRLNDQNLRRNGASSLYIPTSSPPRHTLPAPDHPPRRAEPFIPPPPAPGNPYMPLSRTNSKDMSSLASTPTAQSQPSPWNIPKSEMSFAHSSGDAASQTMGESPAAGGYPTPIEPRQLDHSEQKSRSEPPASGMAATAGGFKCTHPGCTAAPFQTQYLLK
jgi:hypothetical protein